jgi:hypothetical protein
MLVLCLFSSYDVCLPQKPPIEPLMAPNVVSLGSLAGATLAGRGVVSGRLGSQEHAMEAAPNERADG